MVKTDVFISYSRKDTAVVDKICEAFGRVGITYFIDRQGIGGGMEFPDVLADAIKSCRLFLLIASKNAYASKFTKREINFAFNEMPDNSLLPYIIDGSTLPDGMRLIFSSTNWRNMREHPIDTTLIDDVCRLLGKENRPSYGSKQSSSLISKVKDIIKFSPEEMYHNGCDLYNKKNDVNEALKWWFLSAEKGNSDAQYSLGACYYNGEGVTQDYFEAIKWWHKSADQGNAYAQCSLADCYWFGYGVDKSVSEAVRLWRLASEQGNANAQYELGLCYNNGTGVSQNYFEATKWLLKSAQQGNADAQCLLANCYYDGEGIVKDQEKALNLWRLSAEKGNASAQYSLGACYFNGIVVAQDYAEAAKWWSLSAKQGDENAIVALEEYQDYL